MTTPQPKSIKSAAVIIGIDNYSNQPLSSSVNDALEFQKILLELGFVKQEDITLIVAPQGGANDDASCSKIKRALYTFYNEPSHCERLFFFFAGHGISTYTDEAHNMIRPVLLSQDVQDLIQDGGLMIDFLELRTLLRGYGPQEQFFFIDACRDLKYNEFPVVGRLGWGRRDALPPANNAQATLYAVAPLGKAAGVKGSHGVMTTHLLAALHSDRFAVQYNDVSDEWQISMESLAEYVREQVQEAVRDQPYWTRIYMLPQLDAPDPPVSALLSWANPPTAPLTVHIYPDNTANRTAVKVYLRGEELSAQCLPPHKNHDTLQLHPQRYRLQASSQAGRVFPESQTVDVRRQSEYNLEVEAGAYFGVGSHPPPPVPQGNAPAYPEVTLMACPTCGILGRISATALERHTLVEISGQESPYEKRSALGSLSENLAPGPYRVSFRLGDQAFSQGDIYLMSGQEAVVRSTIAFTPLVGEALGLRDRLPETVEVSETLGNLQGGLRNLILPMIALKAFDETNTYFGRFYDLVDKAPLNPSGEPWLSIALAVDGNDWPVDRVKVLDSVRLSVYDEFGESKPRKVKMRHLRRRNLVGYTSYGLGLERVRLGFLPTRSNSFRLVMKSSQFGDFEFALAAGAQRLTVLTLTLQPDGPLLISQSLMRYPGKDKLYSSRGEPIGSTDDSRHSMSRLVQQVQLTQDLYRRGDLAEAGIDVLDEISYTKWIELSASCLAFYAMQDQLRRGGQDNSPARQKLFMIADNLHHYFGDLPDPEIIYGQAYPEHALATYTRLLEDKQVPILAESARRLSLFAEEHGFDQAEVTRWARRIPVGQIWTVINN